MTFVRFFLCAFLIFSSFSNPVVFPSRADLPNLVVLGSYVQYEQQFSTGELYELFWNITDVNTSMVGITIRSHGIQRNYTSGELLIVPGGGYMVIDRDTWTILQVIFGNVTRNIGHPIGEKVPFWIPMSVNETTPVNTMYDNHVTPTSEFLNLSYFTASRECWVTNNIYSETSSMKRWYDKETGIVLKIKTEITFGSSKRSVLETINRTNIETLCDHFSQSSSSSTAATTAFLGLISLLFLILSSVIIPRIKRKEKY
ncbi:MAG: hypothetical protein ACFFAE_16210 [Candidatus Hodarchaeota archaeon]